MLKRSIFITFLVVLWIGGIALSSVLLGALLTIFVTYVLMPLIFHFSPSLQRHIVFLHFVKTPRYVDFEHPESENLFGARNFYIETEAHIRVGVWHILPSSLVDASPTFGAENFDTFYEKSLNDDRPVVLYLHGNTSSRAVPHRIKLYEVLRKMDYHVIAFDYRGYADSTAVIPSEVGMVKDAQVVFHYIKQKIGNSPIFVWGHSLGTGVSAHAVGLLCKEGNGPTALVLESPFNNIRDEIKFHPLASIFRKMPKFEWLFLSPLASSGIDFRSDQHIAHIDCATLILHAEDDMVVPYFLGKKLYEAALQNRPSKAPVVKFVGFEAKFGYAHKYICHAPELPIIAQTFFDEAIQVA